MVCDVEPGGVGGHKEPSPKLLLPQGAPEDDEDDDEDVEDEMKRRLNATVCRTA